MNFAEIHAAWCMEHIVEKLILLLDVVEYWLALQKNMCHFIGLSLSSDTKSYKLQIGIKLKHYSIGDFELQMSYFVYEFHHI